MIKPNKNSLNFSKSVKKIIEKTLDDKKAEDLVTIDLKGKSDIADYMIIASGTSGRHISSLADNVAEELGKNGVEILAVEGKPACNWVLIDTPYVVVHLFQPSARAYYGLEKMWAEDFSKVRQMELAE